MQKRRPKIGLALSGGGVQGAAHVAIIKLLEKNNIPIDYIAGTSAGAVVGALYALTKDTKVLEKMVFDQDLARLFADIENPITDSIFLDEEKTHEILKSYFKKAKFSDLKIPFVAVATSTKLGVPLYLQSGTLFRAIRASSAILPLFSPLKVEGDVLIDGVYTDPVPAKNVRKMGADIVVAVNLHGEYRFHWREYKNVFSLSARSLMIFMHSLARAGAEYADIVIAPPVAKFKWSDVNKKDLHALMTGATREAKKQITAIKKLMA